MRFLPTRIHGLMDYAMGALLAIIPFAFRFPAPWPAYIPIGLGVGAIVYSLMTDYELGAFPVIDMRAHLMLDAASGLFLLASPWLFGFASVLWMPHVILGAIEIGAALVTKTVPAHGPARSSPSTTAAGIGSPRSPSSTAGPGIHS
jgi:hypothetical protein